MADMDCRRSPKGKPLDMCFGVRNRVAILIALAATAGCGGGGGGGGTTVTPDPGGGDGGSGWAAGVFMPSGTFDAQCAAPRTGTDPDGDAWPDMQGTVLAENNWLRSWSNETYLWYDEIADRDPGLYNNPLAYFDLLKTEATTPTGNAKDRFHFTYDTEEWRALSQSGVSAGYGVEWTFLAPAPPRELVVVYADPNTPASDGGLARGARVLTIDGIDVVSDNTQAGVDVINNALYPETLGETHTFEILDLDAASSRFVDMTSAEVTSTPVQYVGIVTSPQGAAVGYLLFNDHIATAEQQLIDAVETLQAGGIEDLVIDLRYNGGGYLAIASQLAYMIAGDVWTAGRTFESLQFNDKHPTTNPVTGASLEPIPFYDVTLAFSTPVIGQSLPTLDLSRVFVLTGGNTCSASESIINSLRGVGVEVIQVGRATCGKPYGFYATDNCGTTYFTIQFRGVNDADFGDYADGFLPAHGGPVTDTEPPGCIVNDDFDHAFADPAEARLAAALHYRDTGTCPSPPPITLSKLDRLNAVSDGEATPDVVVAKPPWLTNRILKD
jgi:carboxyl-terminal processing protease